MLDNDAEGRCGARPKYLPPTRDELAAANTRFPLGCLATFAVAFALAAIAGAVFCRSH